MSFGSGFPLVHAMVVVVVHAMMVVAVVEGFGGRVRISPLPPNAGTTGALGMPGEFPRRVRLPRKVFDFG